MQKKESVTRRIEYWKLPGQRNKKKKERNTVQKNYGNYRAQWKEMIFTL